MPMSRGEELLRRYHARMRMAVLQIEGGEPASQPPQRRSEYEVYMAKAQDRRGHIERSEGSTGDQR